VIQNEDTEKSVDLILNQPVCESASYLRVLKWLIAHFHQEFLISSLK